MATLALDVDGVLLDPDRGGAGDWAIELDARFGITREQIRSAFFQQSWLDVIVGRQPIETALAEALSRIAPDVAVDDVLACWFDADYVPFDATFRLAHAAARAGHQVVLATNQEHRRAEYLRARIGADIPLDHVFYSADIGHQKHDPQFFDVVSDRLGLADADRSRVVFVDDRLGNVEVAQAHGWQAVQATPDHPWHEQVGELLGLGASPPETHSSS